MVASGKGSDSDDSVNNMGSMCSKSSCVSDGDGGVNGGTGAAAGISPGAKVQETATGMGPGGWLAAPANVQGLRHFPLQKYDHK